MWLPVAALAGPLEFADGEGEDGGEGEKGGGDDAAVDDGGHEAQAEGCGLGREDGLERGFGDLDDGRRRGGRRAGWKTTRARRIRRPERSRSGRLRPRRCGAGHVGLCGGLIGFFAEGAFGQAGTGFAGSYELAGKLDEVGGDVDGRASLFEDG